MNTSMPSNFEKVLEFNKAFGVTTNKTCQLDIFDKDQKLVDYRLSLIDEEVAELHEAIKNKDFKEIIDAIADIMYVTLGAATAFGFDADTAFDIVHYSNMSKLCKTELEAQTSVLKYMTEGRYDSPDYRKSDDNVHWVVYNKSTMKILKSHLYTEANFDKLMSRKN